MNRLLSRGSAIVALSLPAASLVVTSCAETDGPETTPANAEAGGPIHDGATNLDAAPDAGCDAGDEDCVSEILPCDEVDWCLVESEVSPQFALTSIWGSSATDIWAGGSGGTLMHYDGEDWKLTPTGVLNTFLDIWGSGPSDIYAVSNSNVILHTTGFASGTATWTNVPTTVSPFAASWVRAVWGSSPDNVRIGGRTVDLPGPGSASHFVRTLLPDGGLLWQPMPKESPYVNGIWGSSADDMWMVTDNSIDVPYQRAYILHGTPADGGADGADRLVWTPVESQANVPLESIWGSSANDVWVVGDNGTIRHFGSGDTRWQKIESPTSATLRRVWGSGPNDVWAVGDSGTILHYDGTRFVPSSAQFNIGRKPRLFGVWGSGPSDVWIVGDNALLHYTGKKAK